MSRYITSTMSRRPTRSQKEQERRIQDIQEERKVAENEYNADMTKLWKIISSVDPDKQKQIINQLDKETLYLLRTQKNPYKKPVYKGHEHTILAFNIINLREKYLKRFVMTSFIGFIYRMLDEWEAPGHKDYVSQNDAQFANLFNARMKELMRSRPEEDFQNEITRLNDQINDLATKERTDEVKSQLKQIYKSLFVSQTKLIKHKLSFITRDRDTAQIDFDIVDNELHRLTSLHDTYEKRLVVAARKLELRKAFENSDEQKELARKIKLRAESDKPQFEEATFDVLQNPERTYLTPYDKEQTISDMEKQMENKSELIDISKKNIDELKITHTAKKQILDEHLQKHKYYESELKNIKERYDKHFSNSKKSKKSKSGHSLDAVTIVDYELTDDEHMKLVDEIKKNLGLTITREEWLEERRDTVQSFLDEYLLYNPDNHVQCAYKPNYSDETRTPLKEAWVAYQNGGSDADYEKALANHADQVKKIRQIAEETYERSVIPPDDTFFRWQRYEDNSYEELRQATDDIYAEKSDVEWSLVPLRTFTGKDADTVKAEAEEWRRKYAEEFEGDIYQATFGVHNLLGSWENNRERRDFYTKNSEIIKRIIQQNEDDQKMGRRLMKQRTEKKKAENISEAGPDSKGMRDYRRANQGDLNKAGVRHISEIDDKGSSIPIKSKDLSKINNREESTRDEVEVGFYNIRPAARKGKKKHIGKTDAGKFHIPAEKELPQNATIMNPTDMHKHLAIEELRQIVGTSGETESDKISF